jgi:DEAD/DEAH box helicase domain-containing protein
VPVDDEKRRSRAPVEHSDTGATRDAAGEALRLMRERKKGRAPARADPLAPGTRVSHPRLGAGVVVLASPDIISVRLDRNPHSVVDLPRGEIAPLNAPSSTFASSSEAITPAAQGLPGRSRPPYDVAAVVRTLLRDAQEVLMRDGLEIEELYTSEEPVQPEVAPRALDVDPLVAAAFRAAEGIDSFYSHQAETYAHLKGGRNVVIATPTASGKTESYNPAILETLLRDPAATALYVFPLVALGFDQVERLRRLNEALPAERRLRIGILNSSVDPTEKWQTLRGANRIIATTPETLHYILLPKPYNNWRSFFRNLRYIVLDEAHVYKGVFGANMGNIVRRVLVRSRREGNPRFPQVVISSATVRDPRRLAAQLTGLDPAGFAVVDQSGAPRPRRHFLALPQDVHDLTDITTELLEASTVDVCSGRRRPVRSIVFLRSINEVKQAADALRSALARSGHGELVEAVADFYADKADKRDVFVRLRRGEIRCLFTTNALMAGIDIGSLDVAIVKNFPGLVMDARQMFGRAGRAGEGAAVFLASRANPFDQFYLEHPRLLFAGQSEEAIANPENPYLLAAHLKCAAQISAAGSKNQEGPLSGEWVSLFGATGQDLLDILVNQGQLQVQRGHYHLSGGHPQEESPLDELRSTEGGEYRLVTESGVLLEAKRRSYAYRDAHPEAILWHNGRRYKVIAFDDDERRIVCTPAVANDLRTQGLETIELEVRRELEPQRALAPGISLGFGEVEITTSVREYLLYRSTAVMRCRRRSCRYESTNLDQLTCPRCGGPVRPRQVEKVIERRAVPQPPLLSTTLETRASWLDLSLPLVQRFEEEFWPRWAVEAERAPGMAEIEPGFEHAVHSAKHAILKALPERIRCDESDVGGLDLAVGPRYWRLYIYDNFTGGLGLAEALFDDSQTLLGDALAQIERCTCEDDAGCLVCLKYFRCGKFNADLSKLAGRYLLRSALGLPVAGVLSDLADYVASAVPVSQVVKRPSPPAGR